MHLPQNITKSFENKADDFIKKCNSKFLIKIAIYTKSNYCKPGTMCGLIKKHKENNPISFTTNRCGIAIEY